MIQYDKIVDFLLVSPINLGSRASSAALSRWELGQVP